MFSLLLLAVAVGISEACMKIPQYFGTLKPSLEVGDPVTLARGRSSCACCAMCHQEPSCASLSFDTDTNQCRLYSTVGSYVNLTRQGRHDDNVQFFIMPKRSGSGEFCRSDSDCQTRGDRCTAKVCTTNTTITCGTVYNQNSDLPSHRYWGVIDGHELLLNCRMEYRTGFTMLLATQTSSKWTVANRLNYTDATGQGSYPNDWALYSILWAADKIRDSVDGTFYKVWARGVRPWKSGQGGCHMMQLQHFVSSGGYSKVHDVYYMNVSDWHSVVRSVLFNASKTQSLLGRVPVVVNYSMPEGDATIQSGQVRFPYLVEYSDILYHMNSVRHLGYCALMRSSGRLYWFQPVSQASYISIYIGH